MLKLNGSVNVGFCQGVLKRPIKVIGTDVVAVKIYVVDSRINPKTNKPNTYLLHFIARDDVAKQLINDARYENLILVSFHLGAHFKFNNTLGIGRFDTQFEINDFCYRESLNNTNSFLNKGLYQCKFLGITPVLNSNSVYTVDTVVNNSDADKRLHLSFTVFGSYGEVIEEMYVPGQEITIVYKLERSKDEREDGEVEFFTNCIVEKIV